MQDLIDAWIDVPDEAPPREAFDLAQAAIDLAEAQTLSNALREFGYTHDAGEHPASGFQCVYRDGVQVFRGRCWECWAWLRQHYL